MNTLVIPLTFQDKNDRNHSHSHSHTFRFTACPTQQPTFLTDQSIRNQLEQYGLLPGLFYHRYLIDILDQSLSDLSHLTSSFLSQNLNLLQEFFACTDPVYDSIPVDCSWTTLTPLDQSMAPLIHTGTDRFLECMDCPRPPRHVRILTDLARKAAYRSVISADPDHEEEDENDDIRYTNAIQTVEKCHEFLLCLFWHCVLGGQLCQSDAHYNPYRTLLKQIYKDLVQIERHPPHGLQITSKVYRLTLPKNPNIHQFGYLIVDQKQKWISLFLFKELVSF